ncbi:hypothetical protein D5018_06650 [Parashewanella curva]|uniref:DUF3300 domain-containing protein n=1 Tax=Parashewanella curva TaxID=2338552 RepID=A0A3L8PYF0_9GAMM|nr:hypothetical protein [Parashewanella curva]RLV60467.1 hypothetical protein D5018_06650 [Parashewanella curva]
MCKSIFAVLLMASLPFMAHAHGEHAKISVRDHHVKVSAAFYSHHHAQKIIPVHHFHHDHFHHRHWYPYPVIVRPRVYRPWPRPWWHRPYWGRSHIHIVVPLAYHPTRTVIVHDPVPAPAVQSQTVTSSYATTTALTHLPANAKVIQQDGKVVYQWNGVIYRYDFIQHVYTPV